ncbi:MAG: hypothetical protein ACK40Z_15115, partial [Dietzia sp.]
GSDRLSTATDLSEAEQAPPQASAKRLHSPIRPRPASAATDASAGGRAGSQGRRPESRAPQAMAAAAEAEAEAEGEQRGNALSTRAQSMAEATVMRIEPDMSGPDDVEGVDWQHVMGAEAHKQVTERSRRHRDSSSFVLRSTCFTLLPLIAVALWGVGIQLGQQEVVDGSVTSARRMLLSQLQAMEGY